MRTAEIKRKTRETDITLDLKLDGGAYKINTNCGFLNHMLELFAVHSGFGLSVNCVGDIEVDFHHTVEDVGIALGQAFNLAIGDKRGINRYADVTIPMDESLVLCAVDISGRGVLNYDLKIECSKVSDGSDEVKQKSVGLFDTELIEEFFQSFVREARVTLHIVKLYGRNTHHIIECAFKAFARALKAAVAVTGDAVPSSKGIL
ncbi:MAG: imidazoleglycerol-phosphate dehydratase HisB [Clostridiales bacterium]|nr:imidazoleglycerol-phosphate dehydratase HisB [Clostridiales bacterium]